MKILCYRNPQERTEGRDDRCGDRSVRGAERSQPGVEVLTARGHIRLCGHETEST